MQLRWDLGDATPEQEHPALRILRGDLESNDTATPVLPQQSTLLASGSDAAPLAAAEASNGADKLHGGTSDDAVAHEMPNLNLAAEVAAVVGL